MNTRRTTASIIAALLLLMAGCGDDQFAFAWDPSNEPLRSDLGTLEPTEGNSQRLFNNVTATLNMPDGETYDIESEQLWVVMAPLSGEPSSGAEDRVGYLEFRTVVGREDADMIPALSRYAQAVGYQFDEAAAVEWVTTNDDGFGAEVKPLLDDQYGVYLEADDKLTNTVSIYIYFPIPGISGQQPSNLETLFDGQLIDE